MNATEYIQRYVHSDYHSYAQVVVSYARKGVHVVLQPDAEIPDNDVNTERRDNTTVFIQMDTDSMPPILIADHCCNETGRVCTDHPDQPYRHSECYGDPVPCPYKHEKGRSAGPQHQFVA